jgi:hypothetical protein
MADSAAPEGREELFEIIDDYLNHHDIGRDVDSCGIAEAVLAAGYRNLETIKAQLRAALDTSPTDHIVTQSAADELLAHLYAGLV